MLFMAHGVGMGVGTGEVFLKTLVRYGFVNLRGSRLTLH